MEYYGNNDWRDYLALKHHGILGMKWGRRNGPPYPLGYGDHSAAEKKANSKSKLDNYEPAGNVKKRKVSGTSGGDGSSIGRKKRYISKESKQIEKRYKKDIKKADRAEAKLEKKYNKALEKGEPNDKLIERLEDARVDTETLKRIKNLELERVSKMTDKDIKNEKKDTKSKLKSQEFESESVFGRIGEKRQYKKELADERGMKRVTQGERNQIKDEVIEQVKSKAKSQAGAEYFKADENKIKSYVDELNKSLKSTAKARSAAAARTKYQTISNPNSKTGTSDFKVSNRDLDAKAEAAMKDWGKKYLTAAVYAEANGYKLEFDKKKNKHYLVKA